MSRTIKSSPDAQAGLQLTDETAKLQGGPSSFVYTDPSGVYLVGPISILTQPENIRIGVEYVLPPANYGLLPSTSVNPQPMYIRNSPVEGTTEILQEALRLLAELT